MRAIVLLALSASSLLGVGCQQDPGTGSRAERKLMQCGLLSEGDVRSFPLYAPTDCYDRCLASASCAELEDTLCGASIALRSRCDARCAYRCEDGALIAVERACDGVENCADGSDEVACPSDADPRCLVATPCDGVPQCADGSDEVGCTAPVCVGGEVLPLWERCNGFSTCPGGEDEDGCATLTTSCP
ncbi:MAG: hypothetical protein ACFCGT_17150 [Sandaracinaceae bacterium]